ncbi:hypothetical protein [Treponema sp. C6A8]|uniref:hypothetical protein n=1 Tax=Treponema sp. C6A8 TaxID=1410609 RepID=UPI000483F65D|nr:hypothetical protein [Treponema sp. C6A8]
MSNFSILNESSLHNTLKKLYAYQTDGKTEVEKYGHIYDIITKDGEIIEIQNKNLKQIFPKIKDTLEKGLKIKVVHPVVITKKIELKDKDGNIIKRSRSSKKGSVYDVFREAAGIYQILFEKNFTLEVPEIDITEIRVQEESLVQSKNNRRRYKRDWNKINKKLNEINKIHTFKSPEDYLSLLPASLAEEFCAKDIAKGLKEEKLCPARIYNNSNLIIWFLKKIQLISETKTENKSHYYKKVIQA